MTAHAALCLAALAVALSAACGDGDSPVSTPTPQATSQPTPTPTIEDITLAPIPLGTPGSRNPSHVASPDEAIQFERGSLDLEDFALNQPTTLAFGPDGRLYVAQQNGRIVALTLAGQTVTDAREIVGANILADVLGIAFNPNDPPEPATLYVTQTSVFAGIDAPPYPGKVSKLTAPGFDPIDIITGLPVAAEEHATNGIVFDGKGRLFIAQGGTTNFGLFTEGRERPEGPLSGAILLADLSDPGFDGRIRYDPPDEPSHTVNQVGGDVSVYASGLRNPFDLVLHSNGRIYATDNGPNNGNYSLTCSTQRPAVPAPDELNLVLEGRYYGHPNRNRGRFDDRQCSYHSAADDSGESTPPIANLGYFTSANGITEYTSDAFAGRMLGDLVYVEWAKGGVWRVVLSDDGTAVESVSRLVPDSLGRPLDVTVGPSGVLYIAEMGASRITYLAPAG